MATTAAAPIAVAAPLYAAAALAGLVSSSLVSFLTSMRRTASSAAAMPALAAAGLVWQAKDLLSPSGEPTAVHSTLLAQPSIVNWHELPVPQ